MKSEDAMLAEIGMEESGVGEEPTRHVSILHLFIARAYTICNVFTYTKYVNPPALPACLVKSGLVMNGLSVIRYCFHGLSWN